MNKAERLAGQIDALAALRAEKALLRKRIQKQGVKITTLGNEICYGSSQKGILGVGRLVSSGLTIYQGIRIGFRVVQSLSSIFHKRR